MLTVCNLLFLLQNNQCTYEYIQNYSEIERLNEQTIFWYEHVQTLAIPEICKIIESYNEEYSSGYILYQILLNYNQEYYENMKEKFLMFSGQYGNEQVL